MRTIIIIILLVLVLRNIMKKEHFESSMALLNFNSVFGPDKIVSYGSVSNSITSDKILIDNLSGEKITVDSNMNCENLVADEINIQELCDVNGNCLMIDDLRKYKEFSLLDSNDNRVSLDLTKVHKLKDTVSNVSKLENLENPKIGTLVYKNMEGNNNTVDIYEGSSILKKGYQDAQEIKSITSFEYNTLYPNYEKYKIYGYSHVNQDITNGRGLAFMIEYDNETKITYYSQSGTDPSTVNGIVSHVTTGAVNNDMKVILIKAGIF